jgi:CshA-type fibril repeat protein
VVTNTSSTSDAAGTGTTLVANSVTIACTANLVNVVCSVALDGSIVIEEQGTYTVAATGVITFTPLPTFLGVAVPVTYTVADALGQTATTTYTPTVVDPPVAPAIAPPVATPDLKKVTPGAAVKFEEITGEKGLAKGVKLVLDGPGKTCLFMPGTQTCAADNKVTIVGEGTFSLDPASGLVSYKALGKISLGVKTPVTYRVTDSTGMTATSTLTPVIDAPMLVAKDDTKSGPYDTNQIIAPFKNDAAGHVGVPLEAKSLRLCGIAASDGSACEMTELTTADGTYFVNASTGVVTFDPRAGFTGVVTQPVFYTVRDVELRIASAKITPYVAPKGAIVVELAETGTSVPGMVYLAIALLIAGFAIRRRVSAQRA